MKGQRSVWNLEYVSLELRFGNLELEFWICNFLTLTGTVIEALRIPFPSKVLTTLVTQAAIESSPDLTTHSGLSGASYGESIPVNPMKIKLANEISLRYYQYANQIT